MSGRKDYVAIFNLVVGDDVSLTVKEDTSTGFVWKAELSNADAFDISEKYEKPSKDKGEPSFGGSVKKVFKLVAKKPGIYELTLTNARPFEKDGDVKTQRYKIRVAAHNKPEYKTQ